MSGRAKYWASESSSSSGSETESEEVVVKKVSTKKKKVVQAQIYTDDESEDEGRVVRNLKDRRFDELSEHIKKVAIKFVNIFENLRPKTCERSMTSLLCSILSKTTVPR